MAEDMQVAVVEEERPGPILGKFVRIVALKATVPTVPFSTATGSEDEWTNKVVDGEQGQCVGWEGGEKRVYTILTFDGLLARVPEANLEEFQPKAAEAGGFDAVWPASEGDADMFSLAVAEALQSKGYCVVQTFVDLAERKQALDRAKSIRDSEEYRLEIESDYLGRKNYTNPKKMKQDTPDAEPTDALERCNHQLTNLGLLLCPLAPNFLEFTPSAHSKALARVRFASKAEADKLAPVPMTPEDVEEDVIKNHILFLQSRKVCMLYMVDNEGGELYFYPKDGGEVMLPIHKNRLVLFRHDKMSYSYKPQGDSLAVQAWMLSDAPAFQLSKIEGGEKEKQDLLGITGCLPPTGMSPQIMSMHTRYPGDAADPLKYWTMQIHCTDCCTEWPVIRFDKELYYSPDPNDVIFGKAYTCHGGFLLMEEVNSFDNEFFGISYSEGLAMSMNQRMWCEVGYECLQKIGYTKGNLWGKNIGTYVGDVGSDWHDNTKNFSMWCYDPDYTATGVHSAVLPCRLSYIFGMIGPTMTFDTACSASLYATHHAHMAMLNLQLWGLATDGSIIGGVNSIGSTGHVGNCQGNILTHTGRCFTFDEAADGYQRGEGCGACYMRLSDDAKLREDRLACLVGSVSSHDGKSASLTAPSGPAQQVMLKHSLKFCGLEVEEVAFTECHGTGTALGDPIEMGAIAAVLLDDREAPLWHTTPKSNIGHLESAAGLSGLTKVILALYHCFVPPNVHFRKLNPHVDIEGYPRVYQTEIGDLCVNAGFAGCSSFGFGGANARADVYGVAKRGPQARTELKPEKLDFMATQCPQCFGWMSYPDGAALPFESSGTYHASLLREEFADYSVCTYCYKGDYRHGAPIADLDAWNPNKRVWITGTWSAFTSTDEMEPDGEGGFTCKVLLGETGWEDFYMLTNHGEKLYPATRRAKATARCIVGDFDDPKGRYWRINGREDGFDAGKVYQVKLTWGDNWRTLSWEPVGADESIEDEVFGSGYQHRYFISGSWSRWGSTEMVCVSPSNGIYEAKFTIGKLCKEEFQFIRDQDKKQVIHPAQAKAEKATVPLCGPDDAGVGKCFLVRGRKHEVVTVQLCILGAKASVKATKESGESILWESYDGEAPRTYSLSGTFNNWSLTPMEAIEDSPGVFRCSVKLNVYGHQDFHIVADMDRLQVLHPDGPSAQPGESLALGPDDEGENLYWRILDGEPNTTVNIVLDVTQQEDTRKMVSWEFEGLYSLED